MSYWSIGPDGNWYDTGTNDPTQVPGSYDYGGGGSDPIQATPISYNPGSGGSLPIMDDGGQVVDYYNPSTPPATPIGVVDEILDFLDGNIDVNPENILPGGRPLITAEGPWTGLTVVKKWYTHPKVMWVRLNNGHVYVYSVKKGSWRKVTTRRATVIGKELTARNAKKAIGVLKKFASVPTIKKKGAKGYEVKL